MIKSIFLFFVFFIFNYNVFAQFLYGVIQNRNSEPIPYAHILLSETDKGTISNDSGFFKLKYNNNYDYLHISAIGFENKTVAIKDLSIDKFNSIQLKDSKISMDEVVVKGTFDSATWYVKQAIKNIPKNYPKKKHSQIAFYREASLRDTSYARLVDAIVLLSEKGINRKSEETRYEILKMRKTKDNRDISWRRSLSEWLYQDLGPYTVNKSNPTKPTGPKNNDVNEYNLCNAISDARREQPTRLFFDGFIEDCLFEIENTYKSGNTEYIEINIEPLEDGIIDHHYYVLGKMVISKDDFAIVQFEKFQYGVHSFYLKNTLHDSTRAHHLIKWRKNSKDEKYYVDYIRDASVGTNATRLVGTANMEEMYKSNLSSGFLKQVNEWYVLENRDYERINWRDGTSLDEDIYDVEPTNRFDISFDDINAMPINPINQKMLKDLTDNGSIDELFIED